MKSQGICSINLTNGIKSSSWCAWHCHVNPPCKSIFVTQAMFSFCPFSSRIGLRCHRVPPPVGGVPRSGSEPIHDAAHGQAGRQDFEIVCDKPGNWCILL